MRQGRPKRDSKGTIIAKRGPMMDKMVASRATFGAGRGHFWRKKDHRGVRKGVWGLQDGQDGTNRVQAGPKLAPR